MRLGFELLPDVSVAHAQRLGRRAEQLGYEQMWVADSQCLWREAMVTLGACAADAHRMILGSAVTNVGTRHQAVVAAAAVTLYELTEGRFRLGVGIGDSAVRTLGRDPQSLAAFERSIDSLRRLFAGEEVSDTEAGGRPYRLSYAVPAAVPIFVAANAPRMLRLAGRVADGVIMLPGVSDSILSWARGIVAEGAREAGRDPQTVSVVLSTPTSIDADGDRARQRVKTHVARALLRPLPAGLDDAHLQGAAARIRSSYDYSQHLSVPAGHAELVSDDIVGHFAIAGTPEECAPQLARIAAAGIDQLAVIPYVDPGADKADVLDQVAALAPR